MSALEDARAAAEDARALIDALAEVSEFSEDSYADLKQDVNTIFNLLAPFAAPPSDAAVDKAARAAAIHEDYDGCFQRIDEWNALEQWERDAHPEEAPIGDALDVQWWRDRIRVALVAVR